MQSKYRRDFKKAFDRLTYRHDRSTSWIYFLWCCVACMGRDGFLKGLEKSSLPSRFEQEFEQEVKRFNKDEQKSCMEMFSYLLLIYRQEIPEKGWTDYLGEFYTIEVLGPGKATMLGQFFTPEDVCSVMAMQTLSGVIPTSETCISDPSAGSGRTLLASAVCLGNNGLFPYYYAVDLDEMSVLMCCINFVLHGLRGYVIRGNSLSLEYYRGFRIGGYVEQMNPFKAVNLGIYPLDQVAGEEILGTAGARRMDYHKQTTPIEISKQKLNIVFV